MLHKNNIWHYLGFERKPAEISKFNLYFMKKAYISGKITGMLETEYKDLFKKGCEKANELGYEAVNPCELNHNHDLSWSSYMKVDLIAMFDCDALIALPNWKDSKGAIIEVNLAIELGMVVIYLSL